MFPLAFMPLSLDSSGNQNTNILLAIDTPKKDEKDKTPMYDPMQVEGI